MKKHLFKALVCMITALALTVSATAFAAYAGRFSDIDGTEPYAGAVEILGALEIVSGYGDGTFGATKEISRAELVTIICRVQGYFGESRDPAPFDDVPEDHWANGYISFAAEKGIIVGDGDGKFRPDDKVLYEEALKMLVCNFELDKDIDTSAENILEKYVEIAESAGITENLISTPGSNIIRGAAKTAENHNQQRPAVLFHIRENPGNTKKGQGSDFLFFLFHYSVTSSRLMDWIASIC